MPTLVADRARIPELAAQQRALVHEKRRRHHTVIERAIDRGELRADVDAELVIDAVVGPVFYRFLVSGAPIDDDYLDALAWLRGAGLRSVGSLTTRTPRSRSR